MKARELLKTDVKVGTLVELDGAKGMVICGVCIDKDGVINDKAIVYLNGYLLGCIAFKSLDQEAKIIKKVVLNG